MVARVPATLEGPIHDSIRHLLDRGRILSADDPALVDLDAQIAKLIPVDPAAAYGELAFVEHLRGNIERAVYCAQNSQKLTTSRKLIGQMAELCVLTNLGYFTRASRLAAEVITPQSGKFGGFFCILLTTGQWRPLIQRYTELPSMGIQTPETFPSDLLKALPILDEAGVTDAQIGRVLDVAGRVMRDHKVMFLHDGPSVNLTTLGRMPLVHLEFSVALEPEQLGDANWDLATALAEADLILDSLHVSFGAQR